MKEVTTEKKSDYKFIDPIKTTSVNVKSNNSVQNKTFTSDFNYCHSQLSAIEQNAQDKFLTLKHI